MDCIKKENEEVASVFSTYSHEAAFLTDCIKQEELIIKDEENTLQDDNYEDEEMYHSELSSISTEENETCKFEKDNDEQEQERELVLQTIKIEKDIDLEELKFDSYSTELRSSPRLLMKDINNKKKSSSKTSDLDRLLKNCTGQQSRFVCEVCKKTFMKSDKLKVHLRFHTNERPYSCDVCRKSFFTSSNLRDHLRIHNNEKPFTCEFCKKSFFQSSNLKMHLRIHTDEKPFLCKVCKRSFSDSSSLKRHLRIHTKARPFICEICKKSFNDSGHLNRHLRIHTH